MTFKTSSKCKDFSYWWWRIYTVCFPKVTFNSFFATSKRKCTFFAFDEALLEQNSLQSSAWSFWLITWNFLYYYQTQKSVTDNCLWNEHVLWFAYFSSFRPSLDGQRFSKSTSHDLTPLFCTLDVLRQKYVLHGYPRFKQYIFSK